MTPYEQKRILNLIEDLIRTQERCPADSELLRRCGLAESHSRDEHGGGYVSAPTLARAGKIRIWIFGRNYRVIELLEGKLKGRTTLLPGSRKPWKMLGPAPTPKEDPAYRWYNEHIWKA